MFEPIGLSINTAPLRKHLNGKNKLNYSFWLMPLLVYGIAFAIAQCVALAGNCHGWWEVCWSRGDSGLYLEISKIGHTLIPCGDHNGYLNGSGKWCGNAGWAPFYPFLIFILNFISGIPSSICGIVLSHLFFIAFLYVVASINSVNSFTLSNFLTLLLCAFCPGGIYLFSLFPLSLLVLLISLIFWSIHKQKMHLAFFPAFFMIITYSSAIIIFFCFSIYLIYLFLSNRTYKNFRFISKEVCLQWNSQGASKLVFIYILMPGFLGLLGLYLYDFIVTGHWNAMYMVQNKYGHLLYSPFKNLGHHYRLFVSRLNTPEVWIDFHNIFFFFTIPILVYILSKLKNKLTPLMVIFTLIMWYIPYSIGANVSLNRSILLLAPAMAFVNPLANRYKITLLLIAGIFYYKMGILFILSKLP